MRFEVFTAVKIEILIFWVVMLCSLIGGYHCFGGTCYLHLQGGRDGGSMSLQNVGNHPQDYAVS
jgi:hypothetical protein